MLRYYCKCSAWSYWPTRFFGIIKDYRLNLCFIPCCTYLPAFSFVRSDNIHIFAHRMEIVFYLYVYCMSLMKCCHLPSFFHQNIMSFITTDRTGSVHCKLSIVSIISEWILINECTEGTSAPVITITIAKNVRKLHNNFSQVFRFKSTGHNPTHSKVIRFSFTAQLKSSCKGLGKSNFYGKLFNSYFKLNLLSTRAHDIKDCNKLENGVWMFETIKSCIVEAHDCKQS